MELNLDIAALAAVTCGVGYLMVFAGVRKSALEWRRRQRICPSCGRILDSRVCSSCRTA
jgi:hypothetical protein